MWRALSPPTRPGGGQVDDHTVTAPKSRWRHRRRPRPMSYPLAFRPHLGHRPAARFAGRTGTTSSEDPSSNRTCSTTVFASPSSFSSKILNDTLPSPYETWNQNTGIVPENNVSLASMPASMPTHHHEEPTKSVAVLTQPQSPRRECHRQQRKRRDENRRRHPGPPRRHGPRSDGLVVSVVLSCLERRSVRPAG